MADEAAKKVFNETKEALRLQRMWCYEYETQKSGYNLIAGIDEAGRGSLAGPVVAAAVILPVGCIIKGLNDSKKLSPLKREAIYSEIREKALAVTFEAINPEYIDKHNIYNATIEAMRKSVMKLLPHPEFLLVDAMRIGNIQIPQKHIIHGDCLCASIAAASIVAKVERDKIMIEFDKIYPNYKFAKHKGYPTPEHIEALRVYGLCSIHRKSFHLKALRREAKKIGLSSKIGENG